MSLIINPSQMLSDTLVWMKYAQHKTDRRETWDKVVRRSLYMHLDRFTSPKASRYQKEIVRAFELVREKKILPSMRSLQFAGDAIAKHESRIDNCTYAPITDLQTISECFFNLLCGTGVGYSVECENFRQLPAILPYSKIRKVGVHTVQDTLEGWCDAVLLLLRSYTEDGLVPAMDYSAIRAKGTPLKTTGGYAPGYEPLKKALDHVERILLLAAGRRLRSLEVHDIMCHLADAVASGGIRRAAMICFFDNNDEDMLSCKAGDWWKENPQRGRANNSAVFFVEETTESQFMDFMHRVEKNNTGEPGIYWSRSRTQRSNPCFRGDMRLLTADGYKTFEELDGKTLDLVNADGEVVLGRVWKSGEKEVVEVLRRRRNDGSSPSPIFCTPNHVFLTTDGLEVEAKDLHGHSIAPKLHAPKHERRYVLLGFIQGDGGITDVLNKNKKGISVSIGKKDEDILNLFGVNKDPQARVYYIHEFRDDILQLGFSIKRLPERVLPSSFNEWTSHHKKAFLCGLFSANGCVIGNNRVALKTSCKQLADEVQKALSDMSIQSYITTNKAHEQEFSNGVYSCKENYDLNIGKYESLLLFANEINFVHQYKQEALRQTILSRTPKVIKVQRVSGGSTPVYDFSLQDGKHWGVVEGVVAHNCVESTLDPYSFCNLSEVNMATVKNKQDFLERCYYASLIGTLQACYTNFSYLRPQWREATEHSALIGVSLTGVAAVVNSDLWADELLREGAREVKDVNTFFSRVFDINPAHRTTLIKPSGTASLVLGCASGMHAYHAGLILRGITVGKDEPIYPILVDAMPDNIQDLYDDPSKVFCYFPIKAPQGALTRHQDNALGLLHRVKQIHHHWIQPGHREGENTHNASVTVSVREEEWGGVSRWMWDNREHYTGIALMPYWGGTHPQLPYQEVDEDTWNRCLSNIKKPIDLSDVKEDWRTSKMEETVACAGGFCETH